MNKAKTSELREESVIIMGTTIDNVKDYPNYYTDMGEAPIEFKVNDMIDTLSKLNLYTKLELKNYFTVNEAAAICDMSNGVIYTLEESPAESLYFTFIDSCEYEDLDRKWDIDKSQMLKKLEKLSSFQAYVVQLLITKFWDYEGDDKTILELVADIFLIDEQLSEA